VVKRLAVLLVFAFVLAFASSASAAVVVYQPVKYWQNGDGAGSAFSASWFQNYFWKQSDVWATVTWIDNKTYSWHFTVTSRGFRTETHWFSSQVKKAHCVARASNFYGNCTVYS
jgi:hypothetical protein